MKRTIKNLVGMSLFASNLDALLLKQAAVVVAFHRIREQDEADGLTVGVRTFERYCRFFARHFRVIPLPDLVRRLERGRSLDRELAITFDDGYRDNFDNAMPVLEKLSLPATFFVVTQFIGTDVVPWWDERIGVRYPWMTWDNVRSLHRKGFDAGVHTRTHVDLGRVSETTAREEIFGARVELERQLGASVESFAYPYGGRKNLTDANRAVVKAAGFRCCCSNFGGTIAPRTDPFQLPRVPMSTASPNEFGFEVALGRSELSA